MIMTRLFPKIPLKVDIISNKAKYSSVTSLPAEPEDVTIYLQLSGAGPGWGGATGSTGIGGGK